MGAALLRAPDTLCAILEALVRDVTPEFGIGISVKIRLLETAAETEALVRRLCATGITGPYCPLPHYADAAARARYSRAAKDGCWRVPRGGRGVPDEWGRSRPGRGRYD